MELPLEFEEILSNVTESSQTCERHHTKMMQYKDAAPFCRQCTLERINAEEQEHVTRAINQERERERRYLNTNSLLDDETLTAAKFETFITNNEKEDQIRWTAAKHAKRYLDGETFNTLMVGPAGTGKSHLAMAILNQVNEEAEPAQAVAFVGTGELLRKIRNSFDDRQSTDTEERMIARFAKPELLVLDDLGSETGGIGTSKQASDFTQNVLYSLMNRRQGKSTIITTNLNGKQINAMYDQKLISRLLRGTKGNIIKFDDIPDKRMTLDF